MIERFIHGLRTVSLPNEPTLEDLNVLKSAVPATAVRRMTTLGLMVGDTLREFTPMQEDTIVYASCFSETKTLERYMTGFPLPSPQLFQTSIHPSAVEQVLIARQLPVDEFYPLTGSKSLVTSALQTALLAKSKQVFLIGGEERGTWLLESTTSCEYNFAFCLLLTTESRGALGKLNWDASATDNIVSDLRSFYSALASHDSWRGGNVDTGGFTLEWFK